MARYWLLIAFVISLFLAIFLIAELYGWEIWTEPALWMSARTSGAALAGIALLTVDVLLPVPSSLVMFVNGSVFGVWAGTALSLVGSLSAAIMAFAIGRRGSTLLNRLLTPTERAQANLLLARWGTVAIVVTRPIPLLAETTMLMAGASELSWQRAILAAFVGSIPASLLYALAGATANQGNQFLLVFAGVVLLSGVLWLIGHRWQSAPVSQ